MVEQLPYDQQQCPGSEALPMLPGENVERLKSNDRDELMQEVEERVFRDLNPGSVSEELDETDQSRAA